jgi:hypothetical protein
MQAGRKPESPSVLAQPPEVRLLKDAIRSGDLVAVRKYARKPALEFLDDRFFTPVELAELYGHEAIVAALRSTSGSASKRGI